MTRIRWALPLVLLLAVAIVPLAIGDAGDLDTTFDGDGKAITDFGKSEFASGMAIQRDGRIVVVGFDTETDPPRYYRDFVLARYLSDGSLDPAFGGGRVRTDFAGFSDAAEGVVEQPDGKLVVAGWSGTQLAFARYNGDASLDSTFDGDGKAVVSVGAASGDARAVALQADGRVVTAGVVCGSGAASCDFVLARLNPDGSIDTSFDGDGLVLTDLSGGEDVGTSIAVQADGKIVAAGYAYPSRDVLLARYNANGSLDASFDADGKVTTPLSCCALPRLAVQIDGKILVATGAHLLRYNADGSLDPGFGAGGVVVSGTGNSIEAATLQSDGKVVVAGTPRDIAVDGFVVSRYEKDGAEDPNFNSNLAGVSPGDQRVAAVGLQADRKIVVVGWTGPDTGRRDFIVLRFLNPAPPQPRCRVPNVRGKKLGVARRSIKRARCAVGKVTRKPSRAVKKGRVISQSPRAKRLVPQGTKVMLVVSRGRAR